MTQTIHVVFDGEVLRPDRPLGLLRNEHYSVIIDDRLRSNGDAQPETASDIVDDAWRIYGDSLKSVLEPSFVGQVVAIHPQTGDYAVAPNSPTARRKLQLQHPGDQLVVLDIGVQPVDNPLSLRSSGVIRKAE